MFSSLSFEGTFIYGFTLFSYKNIIVGPQRLSFRQGLRASHVESTRTLIIVFMALPCQQRISENDVVLGKWIGFYAILYDTTQNSRGRNMRFRNNFLSISSIHFHFSLSLSKMQLLHASSSLYISLHSSKTHPSLGELAILLLGLISGA